MNNETYVVKVGDLVRTIAPNTEYDALIGICIKTGFDGRSPTAIILVGEEKIGYYMDELVPYGQL